MIHPSGLYSSYVLFPLHQIFRGWAPVTPLLNSTWEGLWAPSSPTHVVRATYRDPFFSEWTRFDDLAPTKGKGIAVRLVTSYKFCLEIVAAHYVFRSGRSATKLLITTCLLKPAVEGFLGFTYPAACLEEYPQYYTPLLNGAHEWILDHVTH